MPAGIQRHKRTKMVLPLRFWLDDASSRDSAPQLAHTVDISPIGGRLGGIRKALQSGQVIMLQRGHNKSQFRVIWTKRLGPNEIQAGIESVVFERKVWGIDLPEELLSPENFPTEDDLSIPTSPFTSQKLILLNAIRSYAGQLAKTRMPWIAIAASLILAISVLVFVAASVPYNSTPAAAITLPAMVPNVIVPMVSSKPRLRSNVSLIFTKKEVSSNPNRLQVAEAPQGHVTYPTPPDAILTGKVRINVVIATDGRVKEIYILSGNRVLAGAAARAVRLWHYAHHELNGEAVEAETSVTISFRGQDAVSINFPSGPSNDGLALNPSTQS